LTPLWTPYGSKTVFPETPWLRTGATCSLFAAWLASQGRTLQQVSQEDINAYFATRHFETKATTANRRFTVLRRFFHWALRERWIGADPTLKLLAARQAMRMPKDPD
jgi:integrase/recombinase XerD